MTLPDERYRAVQQAEQLMRDLCDPRVTPRVPQIVRDRARGALRHYPNAFDMRMASEAAPGVFQERMEDLHRFIVKGQQQ